MSELAGMYVVKVEGIPVECRTPAAAVDLLRHLGRLGPVSIDTSAIPKPELQAEGTWKPPPALEPLFRRLSGQQRAILQVIASAPDEIYLEQVRLATGIESRRTVSIAIAVAARTAKRLGLHWPDIVAFRIAGARTRRTSVYRAGQLLRGDVAPLPPEASP